MKSLLTLTGVLIVIATIGALFYGGYLGLVYIWQVFAELEFVTRVVLLSGMSVALIGSYVIARAIKTAGASTSENQLAQAKLELYQSLVDMYKPFFEAAPLQQHSEMLNTLREVDTQMQLLSASSVLELHGKLATTLRNRENREQAETQFRQLIKAIRRDLGHVSGYAESKLQFLIMPRQDEDADAVGHGVNA